MSSARSWKMYRYHPAVYVCGFALLAPLLPIALIKIIWFPMFLSSFLGWTGFIIFALGLMVSLFLLRYKRFKIPSTTVFFILLLLWILFPFDPFSLVLPILAWIVGLIPALVTALFLQWIRAKRQKTSSYWPNLLSASLIAALSTAIWLLALSDSLPTKDDLGFLFFSVAGIIVTFIASLILDPIFHKKSQTESGSMNEKPGGSI